MVVAVHVQVRVRDAWDGTRNLVRWASRLAFSVCAAAACAAEPAAPVPVAPTTATAAAPAAANSPAAVNPAAAAHSIGPDASRLARAIAMAAQTTRPYPDIPDTLSLADAYALQHEVVALFVKASPIAGYKAGLTDEAARVRFHSPVPISGVLMGSGRLGNRATVQIDGDDAVKIELEVAYVIGRAIAKPLADNEDPLTYVAAIAPAVELPNLNFQGPPSLADIVGSDVSAQQYIIGAKRTVLPAEALDALVVDLKRDGAPVAAGAGRVALGSQRAALRFLINDRVAHGDTLQPGNVLITGALAGMLPAAKGSYEANYGALGALSFSVQGP